MYTLLVECKDRRGRALTFNSLNDLFTAAKKNKPKAMFILSHMDTVTFIKPVKKNGVLSSRVNTFIVAATWHAGSNECTLVDGSKKYIDGKNTVVLPDRLSFEQMIVNLHNFYEPTKKIDIKDYEAVALNSINYFKAENLEK